MKKLMICPKHDECDIAGCPHIEEHKHRGVSCETAYCDKLDTTNVRCVVVGTTNIETTNKAEDEDDFVSMF